MDDTKLPVPNLVCLQQFYPRCEEMKDGRPQYVQFGKRKHSF